MAKEKTDGTMSLWRDLIRIGVYKRNQGKIVRQVTFSVLSVTLLLAAWQLWVALHSPNSSWYTEYGFPGIVLLGGIWFSYRLVNWPRFADFLIAVEAELNKVSWPSKEELIRSSLVVIFMMFFLALVLFGFDLFWQFLFKWLGVIQGPTAA
ncbi:MAG: preprotein translocase subunit SecE [Planctomycetaceae bacterium]|nr:preprotein translocase subunit SecE [Planctomycetaceae bacterium]